MAQGRLQLGGGCAPSHMKRGREHTENIIVLKYKYSCPGSKRHRQCMHGHWPIVATQITYVDSLYKVLY